MQTHRSNGPPECLPPLIRPDQIDDLQVPSPDGALDVLTVEWFYAMFETAAVLLDSGGRRPQTRDVPTPFTETQPGPPSSPFTVTTSPKNWLSTHAFVSRCRVIREVKNREGPLARARYGNT